MHATLHTTVCCGMDFSVTHLHKSEKGIKEEISKLLSTARVSSASDLSANVLDKLRKADLISAILSLVSVFEKNVDLCKSAAEKNR